MTIGTAPRSPTCRTPLTAAALCLFLLTACAAAGGDSGPRIESTPDGALIIQDIGEYPPLPRRVAGYERGDVIAYGEGVRDFGVSYYIEDLQLHLVSTIYFYALENFPPGPMQSLDGQFEDSAAAILYHRPEAEVIDHFGTSVAHPGSDPVDGLNAVFKFTARFGGIEQPVAAELIVFVIGDHVVKFRHTYPWDQKAVRSHQIDQLMRRVDWSDPQGITSHLLGLFEGGAEPAIPGLAGHPVDPALDGVPDVGLDPDVVQAVDLLDASG